MVINPRFAHPQRARYRISFGREAIGKPNKRGLTRRPDAPADISLGCPSICGGIITREGHDDMIAVEPAPHGINSSLGETSRRANLKTTVLPDANSQKGVHPNANVSV